MKAKLLIITLFLPCNVAARHHHVSIDTTPQAGFTLEDDIYSQGSYYYPTVTQTIDEFSFGLSGQNLSTFDTQDSLYGMVAWTHDFNDDLTTSIGIMAGSAFVNPQSDIFYYGAVNYDFCDEFTLSVGTAVENGYVALMTSANVTYGDFQLQPFYISGNQNFGGTGVNLNYQLAENWQPYVGYGYAGNESYLGLGVNYSFSE